MISQNQIQATSKNTQLHDTPQSLPENRGLGAQPLELRPYQESLTQKIFHEWASGQKRVMAQLPTGGGKTAIFVEIAREFTSRGQQVLVLAHREELILQAKDKLEAATGQTVGVIKAGYKPSLDCLIQVASVQTLARRRLPTAELVVVDEAHHSSAKTYRRILENYHAAYILGVTATPIRADRTGFDDIFECLVCGPTVSELIDQGYLSQFRLYASPESMTTKGVRTTAGDFNQGDIEGANEVTALAGNLVKNYHNFAGGKRCAVFAISIAHSIAIARRYCEAGIPAEHLDGKTPAAERQAILERFRAGETLVLCNCGIVSEGFDLPAIEVIQIARPTKSLGLWLQMLGRALRPCPGKDFARIIDHTNNWQRLGLPDQPHLWLLEGLEVEPRQRLKVSPSGEVLEEDELVESDCDLAQVDAAAAALSVEISELERLLEIQKFRKYQPGWVGIKFSELRPSVEGLRACAKALGYSQGWVWHKSQELYGEVA